MPFTIQLEALLYFRNMNYYRQLVTFIQKNERLLFWLYALLHFFLIWAFDWLMTYDGPLHLYNARQLWEIFSGNGEELLKWYSLNPRPDNWLVHGLLALLSHLAGPSIGEKLLLTIYAVVFVWGFRAWMVQNGYRVMSWWVFFLLYSFSFYLGLYSFAMSVAIFPWFMVVWQKWLIEGGNSRLLWSGFLLTLTYLTHMVSFTVAGLVAGIFVLVIGVNWPSRIRMLTRLVIIALPGLVLSIWFFIHNPLSTNLNFIPITAKLDSLFRLSSLIATMRLNLLLTLVSMAAMALAKPFAGRLNWVWAFVVLGQLYLFNLKLMSSNSLNEDVKEMQESQAYVRKNATLVTFNYSSNWFHRHITAYAGLEVPLVNFNNNEATNAYFPLRWRKNEKVDACVWHWGEIKTFPQQKLRSMPDTSFLPDQIVFWSKNTLSEDQYDTLLNNLLAQQYQLIHQSEGGRLEIYLHKRINTLSGHEH